MSYGAWVLIVAQNVIIKDMEMCYGYWIIVLGKTVSQC